jgi:threonine aldolase
VDELHHKLKDNTIMPTNIVDLRSDTATKPTQAMRDAIANAEVGDDMLGEDPTVNRLEALICERLNMEAAVFACSGTQSNQMGLRSHCQPGDELLINETGHIANYEGGAPAVLSGITVRTIPGDDGRLDVEHLEGKIRRDDQHLCRTRLVCLENTTNSGGGRVYSIEQIARVSEWARENKLRMHLDGARFYNACESGGYHSATLAQYFDTISICFSKGLGCPMGSILVGDAESIAKARRSRKIFGGALRQAGMMAAAAIHALDNHVERLAEDHDNASYFANQIAKVDGISIDPSTVESNLVFFSIDEHFGSADQLCHALNERGVKILPAGGARLRACTHLNIDRTSVQLAIDAIRECFLTGLTSNNAVAGSPY